MSEISPMKLAENLGVRPQSVYKLIRDGKISFVERDGKKFVDEETATKMVQRHTGSPRGRKKGDSTKKRSGSYRTGSIATWPRRPGGGQRIAQVTQTGDSIVSMRDLLGKNITWENESLEKRIARKEVTIETPYGLLKMLETLWENEERNDLLPPLRTFMEEVKDILEPPTELPDDEEESGCKGYRTETDNGSEYDCEYPYAGHITCEYCIFGGHGGEQDPRIEPENEEGDDDNEQED